MARWKNKTLVQLNAMSKEELVEYALRNITESDLSELAATPHRTIFMRMNSYFLAEMKRPNPAYKTKKANDKRTSKFLKWYNREMR